MVVKQKIILKICKILSKNIQKDLDRNIIACVDDESHLNSYLSDKDFLVLEQAYGFPEDNIKKIPKEKHLMIKIISRKKDSDKYGGTKWLRGQTNRKFSSKRLNFARFLSCFVPIRKYRNKIRNWGI